jgi:carboxyl-terminal processing protease
MTHRRFCSWLPALAASVGLACTPQPASADPLDPRAHDPALAGIVAFSLERFHYSGHTIDDDISSRWLDRYIESLDPNRMFFLASDIRAFETYRLTLDDAVHEMPADLTAAFEIDRVYRQRVEAQLGAVMQRLEAPVTLSGAGSVQLDREDAPWATTAAELDDLWAQRIEEQMVRAALRREAFDASVAKKEAKGEDVSKLKLESEEESREKLRKRYKRILGDIDQQTSADVMETFLSALGQSFDPHSVWFKPATQENFNISMSDSLEGIGATLTVEAEYTVVRDLVAGGPASKQGQLQPGDRIVAVSQGDEEQVDVVDMRLDDVVKLIRGAKGTPVVLTVWPGDSVDPADLSDIRIVRDKVVVAEAAAKGEVREVDGKKLGVLDVPSFYQASRGDKDSRNTTADMRRILGDFKKEGVDAVVVDLRRNGGGSLGQAIESTGLFIEKGPVVQVKDRAGEIETYDDPDPRIAWDGPVVVLTSIFSASASEIFAGALQDYDRGLVVGAPATHGKGTVQELIDLSGMLAQLSGMESASRHAGALKFTTNQFYRVSGRSTQVEGVGADVLVPALSDRLDIREGDLPGALPFDQIAPARFRPWKRSVDVAALQGASRDRVAASPAFQVMEELRRRREAREDQPLSLDLDVRRGERAEDEALSDRSEAAGFGTDDADPWLDEALQITCDYVKALDG